jgi:hypothetical protein
LETGLEPTSLWSSMLIVGSKPCPQVLDYGESYTVAKAQTYFVTE